MLEKSKRLVEVKVSIFGSISQKRRKLIEDALVNVLEQDEEESSHAEEEEEQEEGFSVSLLEPGLVVVNDNNSTSTIDSSNFKRPLYQRELVYKEEKFSLNVSERVCFNCGSHGHMISDCTEPIDKAAISIRRNELSNGSSSSRLHEDNSQKFLAGRLSDQLREALCMESGEEPPYYERMRILGRPPSLSEKDLEKYEPPLKLKETSLSLTQWKYMLPNNLVYGPFSYSAMMQWIDHDMFPLDGSIQILQTTADPSFSCWKALTHEYPFKLKQPKTIDHLEEGADFIKF